MNNNSEKLSSKNMTWEYVVRLKLQNKSWQMLFKSVVHNVTITVIF